MLDRQYVAALQEELKRARDAKHAEAIKAELARVKKAAAPKRKAAPARETAVKPAPERATR